MNPAKFIGYIKAPSLLNSESFYELKEILNEYPFCSSCRILLAKNHQKLNTTEANEFIKSSSIFLPDRKKFFRFIHDIPEDVLIQQAVPVYSIEMTGIGNVEPKLSNREKSISNSLIDKFIKEKPAITFKQEDDNFEEDIISEAEREKEFISEILAELYWKQGDPTKAIRTYEKLSLKFPEKNTYFAAQIEKIKKES